MDSEQLQMMAVALLSCCRFGAVLTGLPCFGKDIVGPLPLCNYTALLYYMVVWYGWVLWVQSDGGGIKMWIESGKSPPKGPGTVTVVMVMWVQWQDACEENLTLPESLKGKKTCCCNICSKNTIHSHSNFLIGEAKLRCHFSFLLCHRRLVAKNTGQENKPLVTVMRPLKVSYHIKGGAWPLSNLFLKHHLNLSKTVVGCKWSYSTGFWSSDLW